MEKDVSEREESCSETAGIKCHTVKLYEVKDIKIRNFSTLGRNRPVSETVLNVEERHDFGTLESQWSEPLFELVVHPNGSGSIENYVSAMLHKLWFSPSYIRFMTTDTLNCTVSVVDLNETLRFSQSFCKNDFLAATGWSCDNFNVRDVVLDKFVSHATLQRDAAELLPNDVLTVRFEVLFKFVISESPVKLLCAVTKDSFVEDCANWPVLSRSSLSMVDSAFDELNHLLQLQDSLKELLATGVGYPHGAEMLSPVSDGWEKCFKSLYGSAVTTGRSASSFGGWNNKINMEASSDKLLEVSKASAEIKRICNRIIHLAKIRLFNIHIFCISLGISKNSIESFESGTLGHIKLLFEVRGKLVHLADSDCSINKESLDILLKFTMVLLYEVIQVMSVVPDRICIVTSLLDNSLFISRPEAYLEDADQQEKADVIIRVGEKDKENASCIQEGSQAMRNDIEAKCHEEVEIDQKKVFDPKVQNQGEKTDIPIRVTKEDLKSSSSKEVTESSEMKTRSQESSSEYIRECQIITRNKKGQNSKSQDRVVVNRTGNQFERELQIKKSMESWKGVKNKKQINATKFIRNEIGNNNQEKRIDTSIIEASPNVFHSSRAIDTSIVEGGPKEFDASKAIDTTIVEARPEEFHTLRAIDTSMVEGGLKEFHTSRAINTSIVDGRPKKFHTSKAIATSIVEGGLKEFHTSRAIGTLIVEARPEEAHVSKEIDESVSLDLWTLTSQERDINGCLSQDRSFMVQGNWLKTCSQFFSKLMETQMKEQLSRQITLDVDSETLELFVDYLETGALADNESLDLQLLFKFAHMYEIQKLMEVCSERLAQNISVFNSPVLEDFSELYQSDLLREKVKNFQDKFAGMWEKCEKPITHASTSTMSSESPDAETEGSHFQEYDFYQ